MVQGEENKEGRRQGGAWSDKDGGFRGGGWRGRGNLAAAAAAAGYEDDGDYKDDDNNNNDGDDLGVQNSFVYILLEMGYVRP